MEQYLDYLLTLPLFAALARQELVQLLHCCNARVVSVEETSLIWRDSRPKGVTYLNIVLEGQLRIFQEDWRGNRMQLGVMPRGSFFNDNAFYKVWDRIPYLSEIQAGTKLLLTENTKLLRPCAKSCPFHWEHLRSALLTLLTHQTAMLLKIECLSQRTTREKVMAFLTFFAAKEGGRVFTLPMGRQEMADELSADRTGICRELAKMQREGIIKYKRNQFELLE